jgi:hypothetical protein
MTDTISAIVDALFIPQGRVDAPNVLSVYDKTACLWVGLYQFKQERQLKRSGVPEAPITYSIQNSPYRGSVVLAKDVTKNQRGAALWPKTGPEPTLPLMNSMFSEYHRTQKN